MNKRNSALSRLFPVTKFVWLYPTPDRNCQCFFAKDEVSLWVISVLGEPPATQIFYFAGKFRPLFRMAERMRTLTVRARYSFYVILILDFSPHLYRQVHVPTAQFFGILIMHLL